MRFAFLVAGLGLMITAPLHAQPFLIPLSPQPQRQPPPPPPPSSVPIAPGRSAASGLSAGRSGERPPIVTYNGGGSQSLNSTPGIPGTTRGGAVVVTNRPALP